MTGTAKTEEEEFKTIYGLDVLEIPTNRPMIRKDLPDIVYSTEKGKIKAIIADIKAHYEKGQPVLVGTTTVEKSEMISRALLRERVKHNILNAKNHKKEAEIIAQAGKKGAVTIATNMAGRGTDILLGGNPEYLAKQDLRNKGISEYVIELATSFVQDVSDEVKEVRELYNQLLDKHKAVTDKEKEEISALGGLRIIGTERHESRRIDNQLRGRAGRQGDPGSSLFYISLEDDLAKRFGGERMQSLYNMFKMDESVPLQYKMLSRSIENAQSNIEGQNFGIRKHVIQYDDVMNTQRMVMYKERNKVLLNDNIHEDILKLIPDFVENAVLDGLDDPSKPKTWDMEKLNTSLEASCMPYGTDFITEENLVNWDLEYLINKCVEKTIELYEEKIKEHKERGLDFLQIEKYIMLKTVDRKWIDHIDSMDKLKRGVSLRGYANEDPLISYKREGLEMFNELTESIQFETIRLLLKMEITTEQPEVKQQSRSMVLGGGAPTRPTQAKSQKQCGRNDPCPCGSGKKFKNCCGK